MGVLIVEVWAVVPEVFFPCFPYQMGVSAKMPPDGSSSTLCEEALSPITSNWGASLGVALDVALLRGRNFHQIWWVMPLLGPG